MKWRKWLICCLVCAVVGPFATGCGYSEEEWRAKLRRVENLSKQLDAEEAQNKKFQRELDDANARIEQLKRQLASAGVDVANLQKNVSDQAKALELYKKRAAQLEKIRRRFELLRAKLKNLTKLGLKVIVRRNRMLIQLPGDVLFDSGHETLKKKGEEILGKVAAIVRRDKSLMARDFQVAGHTDNKPYKVGLFKDNWGLSVMRAREVLAFLIKPLDKKGGGLSESHWSAAGYGATQQVDTNDTSEGRQNNRRCELVVLPNVEEMIDLKSLAN